MAEVFITTGVIGIVATLTILWLMAKHKKVFSVLNLTIARSEVDNESAAY